MDKIEMLIILRIEEGKKTFLKEEHSSTQFLNIFLYSLDLSSLQNIFFSNKRIN